MPKHRVGTALNATQRFAVEHQKVLIILSYLETVCARLRAGEELEPELIRKILELIQGYVEKIHNGKKSGVLFSALLDAGMSPVSGILAEVIADHAATAHMVEDMSSAFAGQDADTFLKLALEYAESTKQLMLKEQAALYPKAHKLLGPAALLKLADRLEQIDTAADGSSRHQRYYDMIDELRAQLRAKPST
jgi:hemerythrin-like domain-containing protein